MPNGGVRTASCSAATNYSPTFGDLRLNDAGTKMVYYIGVSYVVTDPQTGQRCLAREVSLQTLIAHVGLTTTPSPLAPRTAQFILRDEKVGDFVLEDAYPQGPITDLARAPGDGPVAAMHRPHGISLLDPQSGKRLLHLDRFSEQLHWLDQSRLLLLRDDWFDIYDTTQQRVVAALPRTPTYQSALSPDRKRSWQRSIERDSHICGLILSDGFSGRLGGTGKLGQRGCQRKMFAIGVAPSRLSRLDG